MTLIDNRNVTDPYINLATEEFLLRNADCSQTDYLLLYINQPCFVLGKNQSIYKEINFDFLRQPKILAARRISGGGTVYHDEGNLNFAFVSQFSNEKINNYKGFNQPLLDALNKAGIHAGLDVRSNIVCDGKKISGNAQFTNRKNIISHGTLLFSANLDVLRACLAGNDFEVETRAVQSVKSSVININQLTDQFTSTEDLAGYLADEMGGGQYKTFNPDVWQQIETMAEEKFKSYAWIYGRSPHTVIKKKEAEINVEDGKIAGIKTAMAIPALTGINYSYQALENALQGYSNAAQIISLLF